jgi:hypothetical protein
MQWVIFTQFLVELSAGHVPKIDYQPNVNKWMKTIYKMYLAFGHMDRINGWVAHKSIKSKKSEEPLGVKL